MSLYPPTFTHSTVLVTWASTSTQAAHGSSSLPHRAITSSSTGAKTSTRCRTQTRFDLQCPRVSWSSPMRSNSSFDSVFSLDTRRASQVPTTPLDCTTPTTAMFCMQADSSDDRAHCFAGRLLRLPPHQPIVIVRPARATMCTPRTTSTSVAQRHPTPAILQAVCPMVASLRLTTAR